MDSKQPILIQGAMNNEIDYLLSVLENKEETIIGGFKFWKGFFNNYPIILSKSKIGEINTSAATSIGIQSFNPKFVINQGTAGSHSKNIHRGDIVIGTEFIPNNQFQTKGRKEGEGSKIEDWELTEFNEDYKDEDDISYDKKSDEFLINFIKKNEGKFEGKIFYGVISSGDFWNKEIDRINYFNQKYGSLCEEMEGLAAIRVCKGFKVPFVEIRIMTNNELLMEEYEPKYGKECQIFVEKLIKELIKEI